MNGCSTPRFDRSVAERCAFEYVVGPRADRLLVLADHATAYVPPGVDLGISEEDRTRHIGIDIGAAAVARGVAERECAPAILGGCSRLVIDLNRPASDDAAVPAISDGTRIPGNERLSAEQLEVRHAVHAAYHRRVERALDDESPGLILSVHSFTSRMRGGSSKRPWDCGLLYDRDDRAARAAIAYFERQGLIVGDNEPYSGARFGYTMQRHAEPRAIPYLFLEIRNDHLSDAGDVTRWTDLTVGAVSAALGEEGAGS